MLIDFGSGKSSWTRVDIDSSKEINVAATLFSADYWEEHCVECGAPQCYSSCEKFAKAVDGRCARIIDGIHPVLDRVGNLFYAVQFAQWGKLELCYRGRMVSAEHQEFIRRLDVICMTVAKCLNILVEWCSYRRNAIAIWRALRKRLLTRRDSRGPSPTHWIVQCIAVEDVELLMSIVNEKGEEVFSNRIYLRKGFNNQVFPIPSVRPTSVFKIFSIEGTSRPLYFSNLQIVCGVNDVLKKDLSTPYVKCLVWDLDNTLWDGILVEDGPDGVVLRAKAVEVIKTLDRRGILNSICSKNDLGPVKDQLRKFGLLEYFVFPEVNWMPKSENIGRIQKNINIGINAFAFIDDSPSERGEVVERYPSIRIYTENELDKILTEECFNPPVSAESSRRRFSYLAEMERGRDEASLGGTRIDFLRQCQIQLFCKSINNEEVERRCWELVNRTNQLTLAARRYSQDEFKSLIDGAQAYCIKCRDKYGDYGIIGFIAIQIVDGTMLIKEFVMSCRVARKLCEQSVLMFFAKKANEEMCSSLHAIVVQTGRNDALIEAFDAMPFVKTAGKNGLEHVYDLPLGIDVDLLDVYQNKVEFED